MSASKNLLSALNERYSDTSGLKEIDNPTLLSIASRGSCRAYQDRNIDASLVNTLCAIALASPTKSDLQQRDIIVLEEKTQRDRITSLFPEDAWMAQAPLFLVFCANNRRQRQISDWRNKTFANDHLDAFFNASIDAGIALSAFVIAAETIGLGCCPISAIRNYAAQVSDLLTLPAHVFPVAGLTLGWPSQPQEISMRLPLSVTVHSNTFSETGLKNKIDGYDRLREMRQPYAAQRYPEDFDSADRYGWSEDKARQYAKPERDRFGAFVRAKGFKLE